MNHIEAYTELLRETLHEGISDTNDFVSLTVTGEELRRALQIAEAPPEESVRALEAYEEQLPALAAFAPDGLEDDLAGVMTDLEAYGRVPLSQRDPDEGDDLVRGVDEVLYVAAATARCGKLSDEAVVAMGEEARERTARVAPKLVHLWDLAEERSVCLGPDPRFPRLFDWIEELAELSSHRSREARIAALSPTVERERKIDAAVELLAGRASAPRAEPEAGAEVVRLRFDRPLARADYRLAADGPERPRDPARDGEVVAVVDEVAEVRVADVPDELAHGGRACVRLAVAPGEPPLDADGAVVITTAEGEPVAPLERSASPLLFWAILPGPGPFRLQVPALELSVTIHVERPDE